MKRKRYKGLRVPCKPDRAWHYWMTSAITDCQIGGKGCKKYKCTHCIFSVHNAVKRYAFYKFLYKRSLPFRDRLGRFVKYADMELAFNSDTNSIQYKYKGEDSFTTVRKAALYEPCAPGTIDKDILFRLRAGADALQYVLEYEGMSKQLLKSFNNFKDALLVMAEAITRPW